MTKKLKQEFAAKPFAVIKGLQVVAAKPASTARHPAPAERPPTEDDDALFLREMAGVSRIRPARKPRAESTGTAREKHAASHRETTAEDDALFIEALGKLRMDVRFTDELPEPEPAPAPRRSSRLKQLRRGTIRLDLELDLHGLTRDEALDCLSSFVSAAFRRGQQAVLVITGKGHNSPGEPVLQKGVASWLGNEGAGMVAEFLPAPIDLGGTGAFLVFLKSAGRTS